MRSILIIISLVYLISCKKTETRSSLTDDTSDDCVQTLSVNESDTIEDQYIIVYNPGAVNKTITARELTSLGEKILQRHKINTTSMLRSFAGGLPGFVAKLSKDELGKLNADAEISMIEPDRIIKLGTCFTVAAPWLITWNINKVGYGDGTGKTAWIIDSGIDFLHSDLTVDKNRSKSFISGQTSASDENGHGTHVAGIIGAKNNTIGVLGVASGASLVSLRVLDKDGEGTLSSIIQALAHVSANGKAGDAVNLSIGQEGISNILDQQVLSTAAKGIFISIAAGNDGEAANKFSPSRVNGKNIYTVSAVDSTGRFASFSNYGNDVVDYAAPGVRVLSTFLNSRYAVMSGTSMAAPHVTGLLLLKGNSLTVSGNAINDPDGTADGIAHN